MSPRGGVVPPQHAGAAPPRIACSSPQRDHRGVVADRPPRAAPLGPRAVSGPRGAAGARYTGLAVGAARSFPLRSLSTPSTGAPQGSGLPPRESPRAPRPGPGSCRAARVPADPPLPGTLQRTVSPAGPRRVAAHSCRAAATNLGPTRRRRRRHRHTNGFIMPQRVSPPPPPAAPPHTNAAQHLYKLHFL